MEELAGCPLSLGTCWEALRLPLVLGALPKPSQGAGPKGHFIRGQLLSLCADPSLPHPPFPEVTVAGGGRRWQVANSTCLTGRARVGAVPGTRCLSQPAGVLPGITCCR